MKTIKTIALVIGLFLQMALTAQQFHQNFGQSDEMNNPKIAYTINGDFSVIGRTHVEKNIKRAEVSIWSNTGILVAQKRLFNSDGGDLEVRDVQYDASTDMIYALVNATDKGFVSPGGAQLKYFSIYAFDINLNILWQESYADNPNGVTTGFCINTEGDYIFVGGLRINNAAQKSIVSIIDKHSGAHIVTSEYLLGQSSWVSDITLNDFGQLFVSGVVSEARPCISGRHSRKFNGFLLHLDAGLNMMNLQKFEAPNTGSRANWFQFKDIEILNGELYVYGSLYEVSYPNCPDETVHYDTRDLMLLRLDQNLDIISNNMYDHNANNCKEALPGNLQFKYDEDLGQEIVLLSGHTNTQTCGTQRPQIFVIKAELNGHPISSASYDHDSYDYNADIEVLADGEVAMVYDKLGANHDVGFVSDVFSSQPCPYYDLGWFNWQQEVIGSMIPFTSTLIPLASYGSWEDDFADNNPQDVCPPPIPSNSKGYVMHFEIFDLNGKKIGSEHSEEQMLEVVNNFSSHLLLVRTVFSDGHVVTKKALPGLFHPNILTD